MNIIYNERTTRSGWWIRGPNIIACAEREREREKKKEKKRKKKKKKWEKNIQEGNKMEKGLWWRALT